MSTQPENAPQLDGESPRRDLEEIKQSLIAVQEVINKAMEGTDDGQFDFKDGVSLLTLKCRMMIQYLQSLVLLTARRLLGDSMENRTPPKEPFSDPNRGSRGTGAGDMADMAHESRLVLQYIMALEEKMKPQIDRLVEAASKEEEPASKDPNDPMSFGPNPQALMDDGSGSEDDAGDEVDEKGAGDGIYRPPKVAPMPYTEPRKGKDKSRRAPLPAALSSLAHMDHSMPHMESTSGLGSTPALTSTRAKELKRMTEFEEENMTRLVMKKKDAKRRKLDEADIALGGIGGGVGRAGRGGGLEDEFGDILRSVGRNRKGAVGDGYEELRQKGRKSSALARSRERNGDAISDNADVDEGPRARKQSRFEQAVKAARRRKAKR